MAETARDFDAERMAKQRMEKDLTELKTLISRHFEQRQKDDSDLEQLTARIAQRKQERVLQLQELVLFIIFGSILTVLFSL